jgi:hypothetical protein
VRTSTFLDAGKQLPRDLVIGRDLKKRFHGGSSLPRTTND